MAPPQPATAQKVPFAYPPYGYPYLGQPPTKEFREAMKAAQEEAKPLVKDALMEKRGRYSKAEDWISACRDLLHNHGLIATQSGGIVVLHAFERFVFCAYHVETTIIRVECGTGWVYTMDIPLWGDRGTPQHSVYGGTSSAFKYAFRGALLIHQVDEELEGESIEEAEVRKAREAASSKEKEANKAALEKAKAAARARQEPAAEPEPEPAKQEDPRPSSEEQAVAVIRDLAAGLPPELQKKVEAMLPASAKAGKLTGLHKWVNDQLKARQKPVEDEEVVQAAQRILESEKVGPEPSQDDPTRKTYSINPADGQPCPSLANLYAVGWGEEEARKLFVNTVCSLPLDEQIPEDAKASVHDWTLNRYFDGANDAALAAWQGTGFQPKGKGGPRPTGAQLRRFLLKCDWHKKGGE